LQLSDADFCLFVATAAYLSTDRWRPTDARVVSDTGKYDRGLKTILHDELHWLNVRKARCDGVPGSTWQGASVTRWSPHPSLWCCSSPFSSTIR